jgi:steroid delta-isomerase-like uncharacterized protein
MNEQRPMQIQEQWAQAAMSGDLDAFEDIIAPDIVDHDPAAGQPPGAAGYKFFFSQLRAAFPDLTITPEHAIVTDDEVAMAYTIAGTQRGPFQGIPPTGKSVRARGMQIARFHNGKAVERWGSSDELGILKQLGASVRGTS